MRPSPEGEKLVNILNKIGILSWHFSLFNFSPSSSLISISKKKHELYTADIMIIFSKRSVYYTNLYLNKNNLNWPLNPDYYAIGKGTAIFLEKYIEKKILFPNDEESSEALLDLLYEKNISKAKIILLKGENGRKLVEKKLLKNHFNISIIECYKKSFKTIDSLLIEKWRSYKINTLIITSGDILNKLNDTIDCFNKNEWLFRCKIFVVGSRLGNIARKIGWKDIVISNYANNENLLKIIQKHN
ncbi:hypothetical protein IX46_03060 [Buchnera aphidicola (Aphis glycines)]|uniref:Uroporphyrinogen-III synthase n=2 Tax=Buchnera aphidicola TaxID=9 RepID=A0A0M4HBE4_9GAMM|nr:hypothetical protein IX46_03060 [Buchnera aphidicola (Aphis glycines)]